MAGRPEDDESRFHQEWSQHCWHSELVVATCIYMEPLSLPQLPRRRFVTCAFVHALALYNVIGTACSMFQNFHHTSAQVMQSSYVCCCVLLAFCGRRSGQRLGTSCLAVDTAAPLSRCALDPAWGRIIEQEFITFCPCNKTS